MAEFSPLLSVHRIRLTVVINKIGTKNERYRTCRKQKDINLSFFENNARFLAYVHYL